MYAAPDMPRNICTKNSMSTVSVDRQKIPRKGRTGALWKSIENLKQSWVATSAWNEMKSPNNGPWTPTPTGQTIKSRTHNQTHTRLMQRTIAPTVMKIIIIWHVLRRKHNLLFDAQCIINVRLYQNNTKTKSNAATHNFTLANAEPLFEVSSESDQILNYVLSLSVNLIRRYLQYIQLWLAISAKRLLLEVFFESSFISLKSDDGESNSNHLNTINSSKNERRELCINSSFNRFE